jgi:hypothetical protein
MHIEFLVEEESCAAALQLLVPKIVGSATSFDTHIFQGKADLMAALPDRLRGYAKWLPDDRRIVVLVDRDDDDCVELKAQLDKMAEDAGLTTRTKSKGKGKIHVLNRIAIEELEAWFFGDVPALIEAYSRVPESLAAKKGFRDPDAMAGGTWEKLERVLQDAGHYQAGMPKIEVARNVAQHMNPDRNQSRSFQVFRDGLRSLVG